MKTAAFTLYEPKTRGSAVVFSSPHSGADYPAAMIEAAILDPLTLRSSEDAFVDQLFLPAILHGSPLLAACAPRAYVDLNRAADELDPALVENAPKNALNPRIAAGLGVIPRVVAGGRAIYRGKIPAYAAESRLNQHWHPYHQMLKRLLTQNRAIFGQTVLLDCHSMPHEALSGVIRQGGNRPDVVLGDRFGASAARIVTDAVEDAFTKQGFRVARNAPFAGGYITQTYGKPSRGHHAVQIEIDRALYMDESKVEKSADFGAFQQAMALVIADLARIDPQEWALAAE